MNRARMEIEDALRIAVADFLRDHKREGTRTDAARRVNELAAQLGITAAAALQLFDGVAA